MKTKGYIFVALVLGVLCFSLFTACDYEDDPPPPLELSDEAKEMHKLFAAINKREVIPETIIDVQYLIIEHNSDGQLGKRKKLSIEEAEQKSVELLKKAKGGYDFELMVLEDNYRGFTVGELAGHVKLVATKDELKTNPGAHLRSNFALDFQKTVYRLQPGEMCIVPYHNEYAPFGHYIVRRLPVGLLGGLVEKANLSEPEIAMYDLAKDILKRDETERNTVTIQHILIGHAMLHGDKKYLTRQAASKLAAEVLKKVLAGEDFDVLVKQYSYDYSEKTPAGEYMMYIKEPTGAMETASGTQRNKMVKHFGDVAWRLKVGEVGITIKSLTDSPYGFHIIKRTK